MDLRGDGYWAGMAVISVLMQVSIGRCGLIAVDVVVICAFCRLLAALVEPSLTHASHS